MSVLVVGHPDRNPSHGALADAVQEQGGNVIFVTPRAIDTNLTYRLAGDEYILGEEVPAADLTGAYYGFNYIFTDVPVFEDWGEQYAENPRRAEFRRREHAAVVNSLFAWLDRRTSIRVIYPPRVHHWHDVRPAYLHTWGALNLPVPDSLFTNDPKRVREFAADHEGMEVVVKNLTDGVNLKRLDAAALHDHDQLDTITNSPVLVQEYAPGTDVRAYVVNGEFVAAYEYDYDGWSFKLADDIDCYQIDVNQSLRQDVVNAVEETELTFASVDLRLQDGGEYILLEVNPDRTFAAKDEAIAALSDYLLGN